jgi:hypothetical protein
MSRMPGFIEVERRVLRIAGARMPARNRYKSGTAVTSGRAMLYSGEGATRLAQSALPRPLGRVAQLAEQLTLNQ